MKFGRVSAGRRVRQDRYGEDEEAEGKGEGEFTVCVLNRETGFVEVYVSVGLCRKTRRAR